MKPILIGCVCFLLACREPASHHPLKSADTTAIARNAGPPDTTTLGGGWYLQPVLASDTAAGKIPFLRFDLAKTQISGNTGCNNLKGAFWYSDKDSSLSFNDKFTTTKMACPGYNEKAFIKSLLLTNHYRLKKGILILLSDETELSRWARKAAVPPKSNKA